MKKKTFSLLFLGMTLFGVFTPITSLFIPKTISEIKNEEIFAPLEWQKEMENILASPANDYSGNYVDYDAINKIYYLKQDIDYESMILNGNNIYDDSTNITLVKESTFNGNNHSIKNRYDHKQFNDWLDKHKELFQRFSIFDTEKKNLDGLYLFSEIYNQNIVNLTFDNSPFIVEEVLQFSSFDNVNLINIDISNFNLELSTIETRFSEKQNNFVIPIFGFRVGANTIIKNSYYENISFTNNVFNLEQTGKKTPLGLSVTFSLIMYIEDESEFPYSSKPAIFENLEYNNWTITNNKVISDTWDERLINNNVITFTPFFVGGAFFTKAEYKLYNPKNINHNILNQAKEQSIIIEKVNFNNFTINNNVGIIETTNEEKEGFNFILLPLFNDDNLISISFNTILLGKGIDIETDELLSNNFITSESNTILYYSNMIYSEDTSLLLKRELNLFWEEKTEEELQSSSFKKANFNSSYWNVNDNEEISLLKTNDFLIDPKIIIGKDNLPYLHFNSLMNNFLPTYFSCKATLKSNDGSETILIDEKVTDKEALVPFQSNFDYFLPIKDEFKIDDEIDVIVATSKSDDDFIFEQLINAKQQDFFIYDFTNSYDVTTQTLTYNFVLVDIFNQIKGWTLIGYQRNRELFTNSYDKANSINEPRKIKDVKINNQQNLYFIFSITYNNNIKKQTMILLPNDNFTLGEVNFINTFLTTPFTWMHYYWWTIIILVLFILLLIIIIFVLFRLKKGKKKTKVTEQAIQEWVNTHQENIKDIDNLNNSFEQDDGYYIQVSKTFIEKEIEEINLEINPSSRLEEFLKDDDFDERWGDY